MFETNEKINFYPKIEVSLSKFTKMFLGKRLDQTV